MKLKELTIAGFRGFKSAQTIPLDADIIVIHGSNGSGKSSIVEALEWLLLGDISRHERAKSRIEYRGSFRNVHCSHDEPTFVEAKVILDGRELSIRREYQSPQRHRILIDGQETTDLNTVGITIESYTRPILSQGEIKSFVDSEQAERHTEISYILGLDVLGQLRRSVMDLKNNMNGDPILSQAVRTRDARLEDLRQYEQLLPLTRTIEASPYTYHAFLDSLYSCIKEISGSPVNSLSECQKALRTERDSIMKHAPSLSKLNELSVPGEVIPTTELFEALQGIVTICSQLESIAGQMIEMRQAHFLRDGLELISDSICPFCLQETVTEGRKSEIQTQLKTYEHAIKLEDELRKSLDDFSYRWRIVIQDLRIKVGIHTNVKAALDEALQVLGSNTDTEALRDFHENRIPEHQSQVANVDTELDKFQKSVTNLLNHKPDLSIQELIALDKRIHSEIEKISGTIYSDITKLASLKSSMLARAPGMSPEMDKKLRMTIDVELLIENAKNVKLAGIFDNRLSGLDSLQSRIEEFERERLTEMLRDLSGEISHYYEKLNPEEQIRFTRLAVASPGQRQVRIEGEAWGRDINPVSCFSEAHVNCLGISLYFCQRVGRNPQFQFFVIDDPVQSMDEQHMYHLVDLLREVSQQKQLIVLTHQKGLCDLLDDVFGDQRYIKYTCGPYTREGPQLELDVESIEKNLELARTFSRGSKDDRINKSAASLRKAMEAIVKELLVDRYGQSRTSLRTQRIRLSRRLRQLETLGFDKDDLASMRTILPIVDQPHHDDPNWDVPPQVVGRDVEILDSISKKYGIGQYRRVRLIVGRVTDYLSKIGVAVVQVEQPFSIQDNLLIEGASTRMEFTLESMELNHQRIDSAQCGGIVGIRVPGRVRPNDVIYRITQKQAIVE